jgi:hypothetical protein
MYCTHSRLEPRNLMYRTTLPHLLKYFSSLLTPVESRTSHPERGLMPNPSAVMFPSPPPPTKGVRVAAVLTPLDGQHYQLLHAAPLATSSYRGLKTGWPCWIVLQDYLTGREVGAAGRLCLGHHHNDNSLHCSITPLTCPTRPPGLIFFLTGRP